MAIEDVSLHDVLIEAIYNRLLDQLRVTITDESRAGLVKIGKLQDDPTDRKINIMVHPGGEKWPNILNDNPTGPQMSAPIYEFGGGQVTSHWRERFIVEFSLFFDKENQRNRARNKADVVLSRARNALLTMTMPPVVDSFGEQAHMIQVCKMFIDESGGDGTFIWRGELWVEFMTSLEPV